MTAYQQGRAAAQRPGSWIFDCPFCAGKQRADYDEWMRGFRAERAVQEGV